MSGFGYNILGFGAFPNRTVEAGITSNAENVSAKAQFNATVWASGTPKILNISSGVTLGGTGGTAALTIESDLGGSLLIVNAGTITGTGGAAGTSGAGGNGGNAILNSGGSIVSVTNSGTISGGGGGGGLGGTGGNGSYTVVTYGYVHGSRAWWCYDTSSGGDDCSIFYGGSYTIGRPIANATTQYGNYYKGSYAQYGGATQAGFQLGIGSSATQSGASGGAGGAGAGYNQSQSNGSGGATGSNNAGNGGTGGNGGNLGADGSAGATGANGNATDGVAGSAAGTAGKAISGAVNFTDASGTTNGTVDTV